ncbi:MAG: serine acetyltransferase [Rhodocyclaceae bacterium]|nr:serine acetyltransferase [Rhodocyclaceae bacterium]
MPDKQTTAVTDAPRWQLAGIVADLARARGDWRARQSRTDYGRREFPSREALRRVVGGLGAALFPMRLGPADLRHEGEDFYVGYTLDSALDALQPQVRLELAHAARLAGRSEAHIDPLSVDIVQRFAGQLPALRRLLDTDVEAAFQGDPAAHSVDEVLLCYPGVHAVIHHRLAHALHRLGAPLVARIIAEIAHSETGIDIHPGAQIGPSFFIDHGTGVVIGETAVIGERVRLYQAVTLGARRVVVGDDGAPTKSPPRHPVLEDDVVIYAGATLLGRITIGARSVIGGNVWLTRSVPADSQVSQDGLRHEPKPTAEGETH